MMSSPVSGTIMSDLLDELWIQGMTGGDVTDGTANVWLLDLAGQSWSAVSNISSQSLTAGQGFLVYVFDDIDFDNDSDLPVDLYVSGSHNSGNVSITSIPQNSFYLAGNPYTKTIDWDDISKTNLSTTISVWDDANSDWKTYNGSSGDLTNGLIAPFQGFWVQASGGVGSFTIQTNDISTSEGTFLGRTTEDNRGSLAFTITSGNYTDNLYITFGSDGNIYQDISDAPKLLPLQASPRIAAMTISDNTPLKINHLPYDLEGTHMLPFDILSLNIDTVGHFVTYDNQVTLDLNDQDLPEHITYSIMDNISGIEYNMQSLLGLNLTTESKGSFSSDYNGPIGIYPLIGEPRYTILIHYETLNQNKNTGLPTKYALHQNYPNPFNPITAIHYDLPERSHVMIIVYDIVGNEIRTLVNDQQNAGFNSIVWNGKDRFGRTVGTGVYFCRINAEGFIKTRKMILLK